jgi:hypothetical protein
LVFDCNIYVRGANPIHWTTHNTTDRTWIIKLDADMIVRKPLSVREGLTAKEGEVAAGYYGYLVGVDNEAGLHTLCNHAMHQTSEQRVPAVDDG